MTADLPTVSVVVPTYNRASFLTRSIESVLSQTFGHLELIIVDDGSTDGTGELVRKFDDNRLVYLRLASRGGAAAARNVGIRAARGQYVAFLDSDDEWLPNKLERQLSHVERTEENGSAIVWYTQTIKDDGARCVVRPRRAKRPNESVASYVFSANLDINTIVVLLPTQLAAEVLFFEDSKTHEEVDFFMRLEAAGARFEFLPEPLSIYYCEPRPDRMSSSVDIEPSVQWHNSVSSLFDVRATRGFKAKIVAPRLSAQGRKATALGLIASALISASIRADDALKYMSDVLLSPAARSRLQVFVARVAGRRRSH